MRSLLAVLCVVGLATPAFADEPPIFGARDTAKPVSSWSIGLFDPLRIALSPDVELSTHPVVFLAASPNAELKIAQPRADRWRFATTVGFSVPTVAMRLTKGTLFPTWGDGGGRIGWFFVPSFGLLATREQGRHAMTLGLDTAIGLLAGPNDARPLDSYAPLDLLLAPALGGVRVHGHATLDHLIGDSVRARLGLDVWFVGHRENEPPKSPWYLAARGNVDLRLSARTRLSLGVIAYDYDARRTEVRKDDSGRWQRVGVRSVDVFPTVDLVYVR